MKRWPWQWRRQLEQAEERARRAESELWALSEQPIRQIADSLRKRVEELEAYKKEAEQTAQAMAEELNHFRRTRPDLVELWNRTPDEDYVDAEYEAIMASFDAEDEARKAAQAVPAVYGCETPAEYAFRMVSAGTRLAIANGMGNASTVMRGLPDPEDGE